MKNRIILALSTLIFGIIITLIPTVIFPVCDSSEMKMACYYSGQTEIGLGILIALLGIISVLFRDRGIRAGISISQALISVFVILFPYKLIGLCKMETMACRLKTFPAIIVVGVLLIVIAGANAFYLLYKGKKNGKVT